MLDCGSTCWSAYFQLILISLTPGSQARALHLLGMVSGLGGLAVDTKARPAERFTAETWSGILWAWLYACAVQSLPHGQPAARGKRGGQDNGAIWT